MLVDGKLIANEIREKLTKSIALLSTKPVLGIVVVGNNPVIESFVRIKKSFGESLGVTILEFRFSKNITGEILKHEIVTIGARADVDGLIIQLPLPSHVDVQAMLDAVPIAKDIDVLSQHAVASFARGTGKIFPPVASAVQEILERHDVVVAGKEVLVLGYGRLVGKPVSIFLRHNYAHVTVIDKPVADLAEHARESDVIIAGVGSPMLITPHMIHPHMVLIDAGTSESGGKIVGDIDPACHDIATLSTPVPGGVGPIAVAMLFKNLLIIARKNYPPA